MPALYAAVVVLSAFLLFAVQPMTGKTLLPQFGGAAGVWTTSMLFFQVALLAGYGYAHALTRWLSGRLQAVVHSAVLAVSLVLLVLHSGAPRVAESGPEPVAQILWLLTRTVGLPYFLLATTSPLMQAWYGGAGVPYRLFAFSNAASLAGLLCYPAAVEPLLPLSTQWRGWAAGYGLFVLLAIVAARFARPVTSSAAATFDWDWSEVGLWTVLAAAPSALWLSVAHHMSQNIAPLPLLWVLPLSLYLISFIVTFESDRWYSPVRFRWVMPVAFAALLIGVRFRGWSQGILLPLGAASVGLLLCCVFCHGELAWRKPPSGQLTAFYLVLALGGALGGAFVSLAAPVLFRDYWELAVSTAGCFLLALGCLYGITQWKVHLRLVLVGTLAFVFATRFENAGGVKERNFYGVLEVREGGEDAGRWRGLFNSGILHGVQFVDPGRHAITTAYYGEQSGIGMELSRLSAGPRKIGAVGLGIGVIAGYLRPGDRLRFYEINPLVVEMARKYFWYLNESQGTVEVAVGDARLLLDREEPQGYDVMVVDAFSGDAIPVHLLTREAFELYFRHLKPEGVLAVHVTNRFLSLYPQAIAIAESLGRRAAVIRSGGDPSRRIEASSWVIVKGTMAPVARRVWTDQFSNLVEALR